MYSRRELLAGAAGLIGLGVVVVAAERASPLHRTIDGAGRLAPPEIVPLASLSGRRLSARLVKLSPRQRARFPAGTFGDPDFVDPSNYPVYMTYSSSAGGWVGAGIDRTVIAMPAYTSAQGARVPAQATGDTNQFTLVRVDGSASVSGLTLLGTPQGHLYNGLQIFRGDRARITDVRIKGIPGDNGAPPGETFSLNNYRSTDTTITGLEVDGTDSSGTPVAASGIGNNYCSGLAVNDSYLHDCAYGAGITEYECTGRFVYTRVRSVGNVVGFNFEQFSAGSITLVGCESAGNRWDMVVDSNLGSTKILIEDPVLPADRPFTVLVDKYYDYPPKPPGQQSPNQQLVSDITLTRDGVARPDLLDVVVR